MPAAPQAAAVPATSQPTAASVPPSREQALDAEASGSLDAVGQRVREFLATAARDEAMAVR